MPVVGIDGAMLGRIEEAEAPTLAALMADGQTSRTSLPCSPHHPTLSGVGWSSIATGVWPAKHKVRDNTFAGNDFAACPDFLTRIEQAKASLDTCAISSWPELTSATNGGPVFPGADHAVATPKEQYDNGTTETAVAHLARPRPPARGRPRR
ncbi:alkaline phosphatase family protein [Streptomyces sp. NPDC050658]|uniref:alkaline phosphatase family protein n=1 Tax=unclassified Streptomyces TaxID=2593676 RepID=UPI00341B4A2C